MYSWLVGKFIRHQISRMLSGDVNAVLRQLADDAEFVFPGRNSWAGHHRGKPAIAAWLRRFVSVKPEYIVRDVLVSGPPWNTRIAWRLSDRIGQHYANEAMVYAKGSWGKVRHQRVFLDTEVLSEWERAYPEEAGLRAAG